jgi:hypothetical protein
MRRVLVVILTALLLGPRTARAGDAPICVVGDGGVGSIDDRFLLYLGKDRFLVTPIPSTRRWIAACVAGVALAAAGSPLMRCTRRRTLRLARGI